MAMKRKPAPLRRIRENLVAETGIPGIPVLFNSCSHERAWCDDNECRIHAG